MARKGTKSTENETKSAKTANKSTKTAKKETEVAETEVAEALEVVKKPKAITPIRGTTASKYKPREDLYALLGSDSEYKDLGSHVILPDDTTGNLYDSIVKESGVKSLKNIMRAIYMDIQGLGTRGMAANLDLPVEDVVKIQRCKTYIAVRAAVLKEVINVSRNVMEVSAIKAVKTLTECMNSSNEKVKLMAATEVLDRIGLNSTQKVEVTATTSNFDNLTDAQLSEILRTAVDVDSDSDVDIEYTDAEVVTYE